MRDTAYLILDEGGVRRLTKRPPDLAGGEIAVRVRVTVDDAHFRSWIDAALELGEEHLIYPEVDIVAEVPEPSEEPVEP